MFEIHSIISVLYNYSGQKWFIVANFGYVESRCNRDFCSTGSILMQLSDFNKPSVSLCAFIADEQNAQHSAKMSCFFILNSFSYLNAKV